MSDSEELARKERRRLLIERLNDAQMSEEELEAEIEKQKVVQASRRGMII